MSVVVSVSVVSVSTCESMADEEEAPCEAGEACISDGMSVEEGAVDTWVVCVD